MRKVYIFHGGAPDKVPYSLGVESGWEFVLVDNSLPIERAQKYLTDLGPNEYTVLTGEADLELLMTMTEKISENVIFPRSRLLNDDQVFSKQNMLQLDSDIKVPTFLLSQHPDLMMAEHLFNTPNFIIKPAISSGGRGIAVYAPTLDVYHLPFTILNTEDDVYTYVKGGQFVIQPLIHRWMHSLNVDFTVVDNKLQDFVCHRKTPGGLYSRWVNGFIDHQIAGNVGMEHVLERVIMNLGIESGFLNVEGYVIDNSFKIFETNPRYSSTCRIPEGIWGNEFSLLKNYILAKYEGETELMRFATSFQNECHQYKIYEEYCLTDTLNFAK